MAALVKKRTNRQSLIDIAGRISAPQADEIGFMRSWLQERGQTRPIPSRPTPRMAHHDQAHTMNHSIAGMATPEQIAALAAASGPAFDHQLLTLMIAHHEGAVKMVRERLAQPGSAWPTRALASIRSSRTP